MQDIVKILKYIAPVLSAFLLVPGCAEEEIYEKGQPENPDCYGVWFPTQTASTNLFLESDDPTEVTYKVRRTKVIDEITVPVVVSASEDGIFEVEPLVFAAGEEEADLKVTFPNAQMGVTYTCDIRVEDPDYVQIYGSSSTGLSFTVLRADWKSLGTGKWRDDIFSSLYNVSNLYAEIDVEIFEREDSPGYYRMQVFTQQLIEALFGVGVQTQGLMTIVDATDPEAVYIPVQETGVELSSTDGSIKIGSYVSENFSLDASDSQYGTMTEGVITFPQQSIAVNFSTMGDLWYSANTSGMLRIMLPGAKVYDYNVKFTKSEPANGSVTIGVDLSDDVAFMGYKVFEGALDDAQASLNAQDMNDAYVTDGTSAFTGVVSADRNLRISCPETGEYTLVACLYGGEENSGMTGYGFITFGYVASGDDMPVILTAGCAKYRYNKLNLGEIHGIPRVLDAGQCNDCYSLAVIALKLKEAFGLEDVNQLPLSFDIAWYEQKAVAVLLALLLLGFKGIRLGPTLPAFLSPGVAKVLTETFHIRGITDAPSDIASMIDGK